uniref:MxcJ n=1 Tax=myxobacterium MSr12020 TaxID=2993535 RepID=A0A9E8D9U1_9BACT|nr:MxcJ [myxobacterium MSr12020]
MQKTTALLVTLAIPCLAACGDSTGGGSSQAAGGNPVTGPSYAFTTQVFGANGGDNQSYLLATDELGSETPLALDDGLEIAGRALGVGPEDGGAVFVAGDAGPTMTRHDLQADGSLRAGATVSFQGKGIATFGEYQGQFQFVSATKAYFFDGPTAQVVIWNPQDMTVTGSVALEKLVIADATLTFTAAPLRLGDDIITFAGYRKGPEVPSVAAVVVVNGKTDEATVITDDRCGYVRDGIEGPDGKIYLATEAYGAAVHRLNSANAAPPCMLRFDPATKQFDAAFHVELDTLFEGQTAGSLLRGPGNEAFLRVLDESAFPIMPDTHPRVLASAAAWKWAKVTLGDTPKAEVLPAAPNNGSVVPLELGDRSFVALFQGQDSTKLLEIGANGPGEVALSTPGLVFSALKIR